MKAGKARRDAALVLGFVSPPHFLQDEWPVRLTADVIATLQGDIRAEDIRAEVAAGKLPRYGNEFECASVLAPLSAVDVVGYLDELGVVPSVHILAWLEATTTPLPPVAGGVEPIQVSSLTKLDKQKDAILKVIKGKNFDPFAIPDGEKSSIRSICEAEYPNLFSGDSSFDRAWKSGNTRLWQMENYSSFARRGNF